MEDSPDELKEENLDEEGRAVLRRVKSFWTRLALLIAFVVVAMVYLAFTSHGVSGVLAVMGVLVLALIVLRFAIMPRF